MPRSGNRARGVSLAEALVGIALVGMALALAVPATAALRSARAGAGAREVALTLQATRWRSVSEGVAHGLLFERDADGWSWTLVRDGNGNGLRTAEVGAGIDRRVGRRQRLRDRVEGVRLGLPDGPPPPRIPPSSGVLDRPEDPVRFGNTDLVGFSPLGRSSSGTVYLTDNREALFGVVLFGPTGRVRVWRFDLHRRTWTL